MASEPCNCEECVPTPAQQPDGGTELRMPHVGNGRLCNKDSNLFRSPDDHLLCGDCRTAFRVGYKAAREAKVTQ